MTRDLHLSTADVVRHLDGERDASAHIADCAACRAEVDAVATLRADARALGGPAPRDAVLAGALARRAAGERVVAPAIEAPARTWGLPRRLVPLLAAAGVALVAGIALLSPSRELAAAGDRGELRALDSARAGGTVRLEYRPSALLAREPVLRVRAVFRREGEDAAVWTAQHVEAARLVRGGDGAFRGTMRLPANAVFAALAVEDTAATIVDANARRLWTLHDHLPDGRPTLAALIAEDRWFATDDWQRTLDVARRVVRWYPERPEGWLMTYSKSRALAGPAAEDSLARVGYAQFARLDSALAGRADASAATAMWWFGVHLDDTVAARRWRHALLRDHPASREAAEARLFLLRERVADPTARLAAYDSAWARDGEAVLAPQVLAPLRAAMRTGDSAVIVRWADRAVRADPSLRGFVAYELVRARRPALYPLAAHRMRDHATWLDPRDDARRRLDETRRELRERMTTWRSSALGALGEVLLAMGDTRAALDTLAIATSSGWSTSEWRALSNAALASGDTALAVRAAANAAADLPAAAADSLRGRLGVAPGRWRALVDSGYTTMIDRTLAWSRRRTVRGDPVLADPDGTVRPLSRRRAGRITVMAFWSRFCGPSIAQLATFDREAARLGREGVAVIAVTDEAPSPAVTRWLEERKLAFTPAHDVRGEARSAFDNYATPYYSVLDATGALRYEKLGDMASVARVVTALQVEQRRRATASR